MTLKMRIPRVHAMWDEAQNIYLNEVLGVSPANFRTTPVVLNRTVVLTPKLTDAERKLMEKILASVQLTDFDHVVLDGEEGRAEAGVSSANDSVILNFGTQDTSGRRSAGVSRIWDLPSLASMIGQGPKVTDAKKTAWALLQQFRSEIPV